MDGLRKSRRAEAIKGLLTMQLKQEEYRITSAARYQPLRTLAVPPAPTTASLLSLGQTPTYLCRLLPVAQIGDTTVCAIMTLKRTIPKGPLPECWN